MPSLCKVYQQLEFVSEGYICRNSWFVSEKFVMNTRTILAKFTPLQTESNKPLRWGVTLLEQSWKAMPLMNHLLKAYVSDVCGWWVLKLVACTPTPVSCTKLPRLEEDVASDSGIWICYYNHPLSAGYLTLGIRNGRLNLRLFDGMPTLPTQNRTITS